METIKKISKVVLHSKVETQSPYTVAQITQFPTLYPKETLDLSNSGSN